MQKVENNLQNKKENNMEKFVAKSTPAGIFMNGCITHILDTSVDPPVDPSLGGQVDLSTGKPSSGKRFPGPCTCDPGYSWQIVGGPNFETKSGLPTDVYGCALTTPSTPTSVFTTTLQ